MPKPIPTENAVLDRVFSESEAWAEVGAGWRHLHGSFRELGFSIEWHDFEAHTALDWGQSFHPGGVEICLNLTGSAWVDHGGRRLELTPLSAGFYGQRDGELSAGRLAGQRHQFITVELSPAFLGRYLSWDDKQLNSMLTAFTDGSAAACLSEPIRLGSEHQQIIASLRKPPVYEGAQRMWYHAKALEIASSFFFQPPAGQELFCQRQKRHNQDRVQKVIGILKENLAESLSLEEIGRRVGCSHFHLSRIFSQEMGKSIFQCLRELRLERAAELLRMKKWSVTQVALEVGYSSASHFSTAFHDAFGCCPGLYPLATPTTRSGRRKVLEAI